MEYSTRQSQSFKTKIIKQLEALPIRSTGFSEFEDTMIQKYYPSRGTKIAKILGKSINQVMRRANKLGVHINRGE
jgi:hypothetical protein